MYTTSTMEHSSYIYSSLCSCVFHVQCHIICKILLHISLIFEFKCNHSGQTSRMLYFWYVFLMHLTATTLTFTRDMFSVVKYYISLLFSVVKYYIYLLFSEVGFNICKIFVKPHRCCISSDGLNLPGVWWFSPAKATTYSRWEKDYDDIDDKGHGDADDDHGDADRHHDDWDDDNTGGGGVWEFVSS